MPISWSVKTFGEVPSTQLVARKLAEEGAPEGTVVQAATQTEGRGRTGRAWLSPPGGLYASAIGRPPAATRRRLLALVAALAALNGIMTVCQLAPSIRWPNDIMLRGRKVAGVIAESAFSGEKLDYAIVGIGVNCNTDERSLGPLGGEATSLASELGESVVIDSVRDGTLSSFSDAYSAWLDGADILAEARAITSTIGKRVSVKRASGETQTFIATGLDADGSLTVEAGGKTAALRPEDVEWLREAE